MSTTLLRRRHVAIVAALCAGGCSRGAPKVSDPFAYEGVGAPEWTDHRRAAEFVAMPDGVKIAVDIVLPTGYTGTGQAPSRFPVIFQYTPYGRSGIDLKTGQVAVSAAARFFLSHGYAWVSADMRGTGGSDGWINLMDPAVRRDGKVIVDWIETQPWSDGNVGMTGGSYVGWSQLAVASMKPKALKALVPSVAAWDGFLFRPGGIYSEAFMQMWSALTHSLNRSVTFRSFPIPPTPPVVDEDGDGEILDEIPVDRDNDGWLHDDYRWPLATGPAPRYPDNVKRARHQYLSTIMQHAAHPDGAPGTFDLYSSLHPMQFWDSKRPGDGLTAPDLNWAWFKDVMESKVAVLHLAGWFDPFVEAGFQLHATLTGKLPTRLIARPSYHQGISPPHARAIGIDSAEAALNQSRLLNEQLRWYDRWLKGIDNGIDRAPSEFHTSRRFGPLRSVGTRNTEPLSNLTFTRPSSSFASADASIFFVGLSVLMNSISDDLSPAAPTQAVVLMRSSHTRSRSIVTSGTKWQFRQFFRKTSRGDSS